MSSVFAQCTPNPVYTKKGIYPDNLPPAHADSVYATVVDFIFPYDTVHKDCGYILFQSFQILSIKGLPSGFTYSCNKTDCNYTRAEHGCMEIIGNPVFSDTGIHVLNLKVRATFKCGTLYIFEDDSSYVDSLLVNPFTLSTNKFKNNNENSLPISIFVNYNKLFIRSEILINEPLFFELSNCLGTRVVYLKISPEQINNVSIRMDLPNLEEEIYFYTLFSSKNRKHGKLLITK